MNADTILKIEIDNLDRLCIYPNIEKFTMIWRSAKEVHWDNKGFLYSPKPREWTYFDWYRQILGVVKDEYGFSLLLTEKTVFVNIPIVLKEQIISN